MYSKSVKPNKLRFSIQVFVVGAILAVTFFLLLVDASKTYRSSITVFVNAKSEISAEKQGQIVENIIEFSRTLSFYDRMLKYNPDISDVTAGRGQDKRKQLWNSMLSAERVGKNSSMIKISVETKREADADKLVQKATRSLFDTTGMYYDIKNDVDLRIIDGPISRVQVSNWYWFLAFSLLLGFAIAFLLQELLSAGKKSFIDVRNIPEEKSLFNFKMETQRPSLPEIKSLEDLYMAEQADAVFAIKEEPKKQIFPQENVMNKPEITPQIKEMKKLTKMIQRDKYPNFPEMPVHEIKKASAPENLPIADENFLIHSDENAKQKTQQEQPIITLHHEPTEEELKTRLNQLLRGEL
jgi:capsular polysaccharide biosynthesis protein